MYSRILNEAIEFAANAHKNQFRKGKDVPYFTHPFAVGMLLLQAGCTVETIVAGILHDTVEDTHVTFEEIESKFGNKVKELVSGCTEPDKSLPWEKRKEHTLTVIKLASKDICMIICADKLHNICTLLEDYQVDGESIWSRFSRRREKQEWYYREIIDALQYTLKDEIIYKDLARYVNELFYTDK